MQWREHDCRWRYLGLPVSKSRGQVNRSNGEESRSYVCVCILHSRWSYLALLVKKSNCAENRPCGGENRPCGGESRPCGGENRPCGDESKYRGGKNRFSLYFTLSPSVSSSCGLSSLAVMRTLWSQVSW